MVATLQCLADFSSYTKPIVSNLLQRIYFDVITAESYHSHCKEAPIWNVAIRTILRRHRDLLEPLLRPSWEPSARDASRCPEGFDPYLEIPYSSLSNGESPIFLIGRRPVRKLRLADGTEVDAPLMEDGEVDYSKIPEGAILVRPAFGAMNGAVVVKFCAQSQSKMAHHSEIAVHMMFSCISKGKELHIVGGGPKSAADYLFENTPSLLAHDTLYDLKRSDVKDYEAYAEPSGWPYLIMPFIHGKDMLETVPRSASRDFHELDETAIFLGRYLRNLHQFEVPIATKENYSPLYNNGWRGWEQWIIKQRRHVVYTRPIDPDGITPHLRSQLDDYLPRDIRVCVEWYRETFGLDHPRLLHNDLNEENVFLLDKKPYAILDFGDCRLGDPQYDWIAVFVSCMRCCKRLLISSLMEYYQVDSLQNLEPKVGGWKRFTYNMMCYTLIHEQDAMCSVYNKRPSLRRLDNIEAIADELWNLSIPQTIVDEDFE